MPSSRLALVACAVLSRIHVVFAALSQHTVLKVHGIARRVKVVACQHGDVQSWLEARGGKSSVSITTENGLRGLVSDVDAAVGDVLLEVPIDSVLCDADGSGVRLLGAAPSWAASLPSKVQLALQFIALKAAVDSDDWSPFVRSWPSSLPPLPDDSDVLALSLLKQRKHGSCPVLESYATFKHDERVLHLLTALAARAKNFSAQALHGWGGNRVALFDQIDTFKESHLFRRRRRVGGDRGS